MNHSFNSLFHYCQSLVNRIILFSRFFQNYNKLPVTGTYDEATARLFAKERCGCPDVMPVKNDEEWSKKTNPPKPVEFNLGNESTYLSI